MIGIGWSAESSIEQDGENGPQRRSHLGHILNVPLRERAAPQLGVGRVRTSTVLTILLPSLQFLFTLQERLRTVLARWRLLVYSIHHAVLARSLFLCPTFVRHACE
jgi:hypothetical protein